MKLFDFDRSFYAYCADWLKAHPGKSEDEAEEAFGELRGEWEHLPVRELNGCSPADYFGTFRDPEALLEQMEEYDRQGMALPEYLTERVAQLGAGAVPSLVKRISDESLSQTVRCACFTLLTEADPAGCAELAAQIVKNAAEGDELSDAAANYLSEDFGRLTDTLMDAYTRAPDHARRLILDIASSYGPNESVEEAVLERMRTHAEDRVFCAALLGRSGTDRALEPLRELLRLPDIGFVEYREICNTIEMLGGDVEEDRDFSGDADFETVQADSSEFFGNWKDG